MDSKYISITKRFKFDAGHRVMLHESKCRSNHGHEYKVFVFARAKKLDKLGRVIDFSVLKTKIGSWLDTNWDHTTIAFKKDREYQAGLALMDNYKKVYLLDKNPTAENLALHLLYDICPALMRGTKVEVYKIQLWETETSYTEVEK